MDTLTHALSGAVLGRVLARPADAANPARLRVAQAVVAGAAAAAFPDIDFVLGYVSEIAYLRGHRGVTHSVLMAPLWALLLAALMAHLSRLGSGGARPWRAFYPVALGALLIHIAGDFITQFGTMMLAPFSDRRFGLGTTFIIDLVFSGLLVAGLLASVLWRRSRLPAALALVAVAGWVGLGWIGRGEAIEAGRAYAAAHQIPIVSLDAAPRPASPFNWTVILFDGRDYHIAHLNTRRSAPLVAGPDDNFVRRFSAPYLPVAQAVWERRPKFGNSAAEALARSVWDAEDFAFYRWFALFPVLDHVDPGALADMRCAAFRDLRFEMPGRTELPFRYGLCGAAEGPWRLYKVIGEGRRWLDLGGARAAE